MTNNQQQNDPMHLEEVAGSFIHEIKNHLNTLSLNLQLLGEDFEQPESPRERKALERITRLHDECRRLVELSNDFLRFARVDDLQPEPTNLAELVARMIDFLGPTAKVLGIEITWYATADLPLVFLDRDIFEKVLLNLLLNAEDAMPDGGKIILQARHEAEQVVLEVIDSGEGIAPEALSRVFQPFFTTKPGGHGLGLATARRIVVAHGGAIHVESECGVGTKFTLHLPCVTPV